MIAALVLSLFESAIYTNAQVVYESVTDEIKMDDSFVELLQTDPDLIYEKYDNVVDIQKVALEESQVQECVEAYEQSVDGVIEEINCEVTGEGYYQASNRSSPLCYGDFDMNFYSTSAVEDTSGGEFRLLVRTPTTSGTTIYLDFGTSILD